MIDGADHNDDGGDGDGGDDDDDNNNNNNMSSLRCTRISAVHHPFNPCALDQLDHFL
jgi:hypothetical protein